jgi:hypothetical protein
VLRVRYIKSIQSNMNKSTCTSTTAVSTSNIMTKNRDSRGRGRSNIRSSLDAKTQAVLQLHDQGTVGQTGLQLTRSNNSTHISRGSQRRLVVPATSSSSQSSSTRAQLSRQESSRRRKPTLRPRTLRANSEQSLQYLDNYRSSSSKLQEMLQNNDDDDYDDIDFFDDIDDNTTTTTSTTNTSYCYSTREEDDDEPSIVVSLVGSTCMDDGSNSQGSGSGNNSDKFRLSFSKHDQVRDSASYSPGSTCTTGTLSSRLSRLEDEKFQWKRENSVTSRTSNATAATARTSVMSTMSCGSGSATLGLGLMGLGECESELFTEVTIMGHASVADAAQQQCEGSNNHNIFLVSDDDGAAVAIVTPVPSCANNNIEIPQERGVPKKKKSFFGALFRVGGLREHQHTQTQTRPAASPASTAILVRSTAKAQTQPQAYYTTKNEAHDQENGRNRPRSLFSASLNDRIMKMRIIIPANLSLQKTPVHAHVHGHVYGHDDGRREKMMTTRQRSHSWSSSNSKRLLGEHKMSRSFTKRHNKTKSSPRWLQRASLEVNLLMECYRDLALIIVSVVVPNQ